MRIEMKSEIVKVLDSISGIANSSPDYPKEMAVFPHVVYRTTASPYFIDSDRNEIQTRWHVMIEVYGVKSVFRLADDIANGMRLKGFSVSQRDSNTAGINRVVLECKGIVDNTQKQLYL